MKYYLGLDPGKSGGIAVINAGEITAPKLWQMPETEHDLWETLRGIAVEFPSLTAAVEKVHAMPGQGVTSMFTFGKGYGALRMALIALGIPFRDVTPQAWQKELGCLTAGDKMVAVKMAQQLFPHAELGNTKKSKLAVADALLIAEWLRRQP